MMKEEDIFFRNQQLSMEFDLYITEHPEIEDQIPDNALIVLLPEYDKDLAQKNRELALKHREPDQPIVYVTINRLRPSRLEGLQLQVA
ncbi:MAG: DUF5647 family protein [Deltaproteobacteria bacterium]|nr:DUF5647 family protein [Deltaproteobacteria bacterium]